MGSPQASLIASPGHAQGIRKKNGTLAQEMTDEDDRTE
jgi:hypothetical protein